MSGSQKCKKLSLNIPILHFWKRKKNDKWTNTLRSLVNNGYDSFIHYQVFMVKDDFEFSFFNFYEKTFSFPKISSQNFNVALSQIHQGFPDKYECLPPILFG